MRLPKADLTRPVWVSDSEFPGGRRPRLLDAFCCAGGSAMGYHRAGFEVVGVDIDHQKNFPFEFHQGDALEFIYDHGHEFDVIHASPPCQHYARVTRWRGSADDHPDMVADTRALLQHVGKPWVIENVPEAPLRADVTLCGSMFGLQVRRHRIFELFDEAELVTPPCNHHPGLKPFMHKQERAYADAMGCYWMSSKEGREAIPPAYTEFIGKHLMDVYLERVTSVPEAA